MILIHSFTFARGRNQSHTAAIVQAAQPGFEGVSKFDALI